MEMPISCLLPVSRTYPRPGQRRFLWLSDGAGSGSLTIIQGRSDSESYRVEPDGTATAPVRRWHLCRTTGEITSDRSGNEQVSLTPAGWECSCTGFTVHRIMEQRAARAEGRPPVAVLCKHAAAAKILRHLEEIG